MRPWLGLSATVGAVLLGGTIAARSAFQGPTVRALDEPALREYAGVYRRAPDAFTYLQLWSELTGKNQLVAFENRARFERSIQQVATGSSRAPAPRWRHRSRRASSSCETLPERSGR
jgi:hypothetical protein